MQFTPESSARPDDPHVPHEGVSLPSAVIVSAFALLFALACVLWLSLREERKRLIEQAYAAADRSALRLAVHAAETIDRADQATLVIKSARENGNLVTLELLSRGRVTSEDVASAFLVTDERGTVIDTTSPDVVLNLADDDHFKRLADGVEPGLTIGVAAPDAIRGGWVIPMMRRIEGPTGFGGVVVALVRPQALLRGFGEDTEDGVSRSIVGLDGRIRARMAERQLSVEGRVANATMMLDRLRINRAESRFAISPSTGLAVVAAGSAVANRDLMVVASTPATAVEAAFADARDRMLGWGSAAGLLLVTGAVMLWQQARQLEASRRAARRANTLYVATLEGSLDSLWLMDPVRGPDGEIVDFVITEANRRSLAMVNLPREQVVGRHVGELIPNARTGGLVRMLARVHGSQQAYDTEAPGAVEKLIGRWLHLQAVPAGESVALISRDITERREAAQRLAEREAFLRTLLDALPLAVYAKSARAADHGEVRFWNKAAEQQYGLSSEQAVGLTTHDYLPGSAAQAILQDTEVARERRAMSFPEVVFETEAGTRYLDFLKAPVLGADDEVDMILVIAEDVTDQRAAAEQLRLVSRIVHDSGDAVLLTDRRGRVVLANPAFASITGRAADALLGASALDLGLPALRDNVLAGVEAALRDARHWAGECPLPRLHGAALETWLNISAIADETGATTHHAWLFSNISVLKAQERQLVELTRRDALTGLSNRRHFEETLEAATARARRHGQPLALLYLDLDGFKQINDTLGHEAGDRLLVEVAQRLRDAVRATDMVSRLGGDEFTVILEYAGSAADRALQCRRLLDELSRPYELAGRSVLSTPSIGIAVYDPAESIESLRHRADVAMYEAKRSGRGQMRDAQEPQPA